MIFGFNTDVKSGDTVYHVQSEAREPERILQTQVFVRGRCIGKHTTSYSDKVADADFSEKQMEKMLREQHKSVLTAVREGRLESILDKPENHSRPLKLEWLNADSASSEDALVVRLMVCEGEGAAVQGAQITSRVKLGQDPPLYCQAVSDSSGHAELKIASAASLSNSNILIQATHSGRVTTRKFRLRKKH